MKCSYCGGLVTWRGPITDLTHTECESCGQQNCQEVEPTPEDDEPELEWEHPCQFRGEPTKTPAGEACSSCGLREERIDASGVPTVESPRKPITSLAEFCAEGERLGLTAVDLVELLSKRPEFADCLPGADGAGACPECNGAGEFESALHNEKCETCAGTGKAGVPAVEAPSNEAVEEDRRTVLQMLYEAHHREPCGPTLEAISAAIQHLQAVDAPGLGGRDA